jgi:hypothetical protein
MRADRQGARLLGSLRALCLALCLALFLGLSLGLACEPGRSFSCLDPTRIVELEDIHYEGVDCPAAIAVAESRLTTAYYRKACEQLAPGAGLPERVDDAHVAACRPAAEEAGGSLLGIQLCCPPAD